MLSEFHLPPEYVLRRWTEEELSLMLLKRAERLERMRERARGAERSNSEPRDDDGVLLGMPDFMRNRVSPEAFNRRLAAGNNFRGYGLSITPQRIELKKKNA